MEMMAYTVVKDGFLERWKCPLCKRIKFFEMGR